MRDGNVHNDTFTHGDSLQLKNGCWYFHRFGKSFKSGTYKGLDLAFGREEQKIYGGILIRAIEPVAGEFIEGPCRSVDTILRLNSSKDEQMTEVKHLVPKEDFSWNAFNPESRLYLREASEKFKTRILRAPRVGLTLNKYDEFKETYWMSDYRFAS